MLPKLNEKFHFLIRQIPGSYSNEFASQSPKGVQEYFYFFKFILAALCPHLHILLLSIHRINFCSHIVESTLSSTWLAYSLCGLLAVYLYHISPNRLNMSESLHNNMPFTAPLNACTLEINSLWTDYDLPLCILWYAAPNKGLWHASLIIQWQTLNFLQYHQLQNHSEAYHFNGKCIIQPAYTCRS